MSSEDYYTAWLIYLICTVGLTAVFWKFTASTQWHETSKILRLSLIAILLTPYFSNPDDNTLAPAIVIVVFETLFNDPKLAIKAATPILVVLTAVIASSLIYSLSKRNRP